MWWDWSQLTILDSFLFSLVSLIVLYFIGWGILGLFSLPERVQRIFSSEDFFQRINRRIVFGFVFVFILSFLSSALNSFLLTVFITFGLAAVGFLKRRPRFNFGFLRNLNAKQYVYPSILFALLTAILLVSMSVSAGSYGSTNDDAAFHTLNTYILVQNPSALISRSALPYADFILNYPSAPHVLSAFLMTSLDVSVQKIVILVSSLLPCLIAISFYSTIKVLLKSRTLATMSTVLAGFFVMSVFFYPISWGGLPLLLSLWFSVGSMGLIYVLLFKGGRSYVSALLLGLLFLTASQTYPDALLVLIFWSLIVLFTSLIVNRLRIRVTKQVLSNLLLLFFFLLPLLVSIPYFYAVFSSYDISRLQVDPLDPPANILAESIRSRIDFNWLIDLPALSSFYSEFGKLLAMASVVLILVVLFAVPMIRRRISVCFPIQKVFARNLFLIYFFSLLIIVYLALTLNLPINALNSLLDPQRVWQHITIPATMLASIVLFFIVYCSYSLLKRLYHLNGKVKNKFFAVALLVLLFSSFYFLSAPSLFGEQRGVYEASKTTFKFYQTLDPDDLMLMRWISENVPRNANVLVSMADSGQFVTSIGQRTTTSYYNTNSSLKEYSDLMNILTSNASISTAAPLLFQFNVSHVFIGSTATTFDLDLSYYRQLNVTQFLASPFFVVEKEYGDARLLRFNISETIS